MPTNERSTCIICDGLLLSSGTCPTCMLRLAQDVVGCDANSFGEESRVLESKASKSKTGSSRFGDYELIEEIARGGMGIVYKARQVSLDRTVVVKTIHGGLLADRREIERFQYEARAASRMDHPHIVPIYDVGEFEGQHFFTMRYFPDGTLAGRMDVFQMPQGITSTNVARDRQKRIAKVLSTLARAVHFAHQHGIIHRDLKPSNILLDENGAPHVADFSLAKVDDEDFNLTLTGAVLGTPGYMSPEQALGQSKDVTVATDVYGLGTVLYELLTGRVPFEGPTPSDILLKIQSTTPSPPSRIVQSVHRDLETICLRCLEKAPGQRYGSALELAEELERFMRGEPIRAHPVSAIGKWMRWQKRKPVVAGLIYLATGLLITGVSGVMWQRNKVIDTNRDLTNLVYRLDRELVDARMEQGRPREALRVLANRLEEDPSNRIAASRAVSILEQTSVPLPDAPPIELGTSAWSMRFDADRDLAAVVVGHNKRAIRGGGARTHAFKVPGPRESIRLWHIKTGMVSKEPMQHEGLIHDMTFGHSGKLLVSASWDGSVKVWNVASGQLLKTLPHRSAVWAVRFNETEDVLITSCFDKENKGLVSFWDTVTWQLIRKIPLPNRSVRSLDTSHDNKLFSVGVGRNSVRDMATGKVVMNPARHSDFLFTIQFSPDASKIVTASMDTTSRIFDLKTGKEHTPPLRHTRAVHAARFSPSGLLIATASNDNTAQVWDADTGQPMTPGLLHESSVIDVRFSDDGQKILTVTSNGVAVIWDAFTGREIARLGAEAAGITDARFDDTGRRIITVSRSGLGARWDISPSRTWGEPMPLDLKQRNASYVPMDGKTYYYRPNHSGLLDVFPSDHSVVLERRKIHGSKINSLEFNPDGTHFITASKDGSAKVWQSENLELKHTLSMEGAVVSAHYHPKGKSIVTATEAGRIRIWDAEQGILLSEPFFYNARLADARFDPEGKRLVAAFLDGTVRVLDADTGEVIHGPLRHSSPLSFANMLMGGRRLIAVEADGRIRLWDLERELPLGQAMELPRKVAYAMEGDDASSMILYPAVESIEDLEAPYRVTLDTPPNLAHPAFIRFVQLAVQRLDAVSEDSYKTMVHELWGMRQEWGSAIGEDFYGTWLRWMFSDRFTRPITPGAVMPTSRFLEISAARKTDSEALMRYLLDWMPLESSSFTRLAETMSAKHSIQRLGIYHLARHATEMAPDNSEAWHARARAASRLDRDREAVACIQRALALDPARQAFLHSRRYILEKAARNKNILDVTENSNAASNAIITRIRNLNRAENKRTSVSLTVDPEQNLSLNGVEKQVVELPHGSETVHVEVPFPSIATSRPGNQALSLDGVDDYVQLGNLPLGDGNFTLETWIKADQPQRGTYQYLLTNRSFAIGNGTGGRWFFFGINPAGQACLGLSPSGHPFKVKVSGKTVLDTGWHHVAAVRDGTTLLLFLDGRLDGKLENVAKRNISNKQPDGRIGGYPDFDRYYYDGIVDELRMWTVARSPAEIESYSKRGLTGTEDGLFAYYRFNHGVTGAPNHAVTGLKDFSPRMDHGVLRLFRLQSPDSNWVAGVPQLGLPVVLINDRTGHADASGPYSEGKTMLTWTVTDSTGDLARCATEVVVRSK